MKRNPNFEIKIDCHTYTSVKFPSFFFMSLKSVVFNTVASLEVLPLISGSS